MPAKGFEMKKSNHDLIRMISRKQNVSKFEALKKLKEARKEGRKMNYEIEEVFLKTFVDLCCYDCSSG